MVVCALAADMFNHVLNLKPTLSALLDAEGNIVLASRRFRDFFQESAPQRPISEVLAGLDPGSKILARLARREPFDEPGVRLRHPYRGELQLDVQACPLAQNTLLVMTVRDDSATGGIPAAPGLRNEAVARFAGGIAHDLNNLLAAIIATAQAGIADRAAKEGDPHADFLSIIEEAERGVGLAHSLSAIAFEGAGDASPVDLKAEVRAAAAVIRRGSGAAPIHLVIDPRTPHVVGSGARLHQLVLNLLINARDAVRERGHQIEVRLGWHESGGVELVVEDDGPGIPPALRQRIFQPYFSTKGRGDAKEVRWGRGLGLTITAAIAEASGAAIEVGDRPGGGARFVVRWAADAVEPTVVPASSPAAPEVSPAMVLLADDEASLVGAMARQLRRLGHGVYAAMSAQECRRLFETYSDSIDVAVLDVVLGDGDGRRLASQFRAVRPDLGVVLISATGSALDAEEPNLRFLTKPFDLQQLSWAIERARLAAQE